MAIASPIQAAAAAAGGSVAGIPGAVAGLALPAALGRMLMSRPAQAYLGGSIPGQQRLSNAIRGPDQERINRALAALLRAQSSQVPAVQGR